MTTARLSEHARERCAEMGVSTKVVKAIVRTPDVRRPSRGLVVATSDEHPSLSVLYEDGDPPFVVSVLFKTGVDYVRAGASFVARA